MSTLCNRMALHLARPKHRFLTNPSLFHLFSTSSNHSNNENDNDNDNESPGGGSSSGHNASSSVSSYFRDVKASLKQPQTERPTSPFSRNLANPSVPTSKPIPLSASVAEIRKNLSEFRNRYAVPPPSESSPTPSQSRSQISFQELYKRNVMGKQGKSNETPATSAPVNILPFETIRESVRQMKSNSGANNAQRFSLSDIKNSFKLTPSEGKIGSPVIGGTTELPLSVFGKEIKERTKEGDSRMTTEFVKMYTHGELGEKLKQLRPEKRGEGWFSLQELNERLMKLRELEEKENDLRMRGFSFRDLRESLVKLNDSGDKQKQVPFQRVDILDHLGRTPVYMLHPPKEHLVEKYFHPDNMSSAEKLKIELAKVRDEFKMSETDCGSARVQVAQLTTKIKHLSSVLHKKDKHSRKGLLAMVEKRKKLLKYLRRTDWDSYCLVLSKLGLRDNPDYKH